MQAPLTRSDIPRIGDVLAASLPPGSLPATVAELSITGLALDSRNTAPGDLFAALPGTHVDGARFALAAETAGAVAILTGLDQDIDPAVTLPVLRVADPRRALALAAAHLYGPQPDTVVAVTGTSGKTSVAEFVRQIFAHAGHRAASLGTLGVTTAEGVHKGALTTPDAIGLHRDLADLSRAGITHLAMEASSHGIDQRRLDGVVLKAAGFTNLGRDHLDYHADMEAYFAAKLRLFDTLLPDGGIGVVDVDSHWGERVAGTLAERGVTVFTVGKTGGTLRMSDCLIDAGGQHLLVRHCGTDHKVSLPLVGVFQAQNAVMAAGLAIAAGIDPDKAIAALGHLSGAPGRLERVGASRHGAPVFVDYAHKPDALEEALKALRPFTQNRLIVVVGAGGDRDPGKRPLMGQAAIRNADRVIITDDNPRSEDPAAIRREILAAAPGAIEIGDRAAAISEAIACLDAGDVLLIAGKGHETGQIVGDEVRPFSDQEVARACLAEAPA